RQRQRELKRIMNREDLQMQTPSVIVPATIPDATPYNLDSGQLVKLSLNRRMELLQTELQIASESANVDAARNATLPLLSLQYVYGVSGLDREYANAVDQVDDRRFARYSAGLHLEVPVGNEPARARLRAAILRRLQM